MNLSKLKQILQETVVPNDSQDDGVQQIDFYFITVSIDKVKAEAHRDELVALLKTYPEPERLATLVDYIEVGGEIQDQGAALQLFALGEVLGLWEVYKPSGNVLISGFRPDLQSAPG